MVAGSFALAIWDPKYLKLLQNLVNAPIPAAIDTDLATTPPPILLDPMEDGNVGATAIRVRCTVYMPLPFIPIVLACELNSIEISKRIWGALVTANLEADCRVVINWLRVALVCSAPKALSSLLTSDPTATLVDAVLIKYCHAVLTRDLPGLDPSMSRATGSLIATNIKDLVLEQSSEWLEVEALPK